MNRPCPERTPNFVSAPWADTPVTALRFSLDLPAHYSPQQALSFHARDPLHLSEVVTEHVLRKAVAIDGRMALFEIVVHPDAAQCVVTIEPGDDGAVHLSADAHLTAAARRLLGLALDTAAFERAFQNHPVLGHMVRAQRGLVIPQAATPFEALTWAITGQQISLAVAIGLRRRLITLAGRRHPSGLYCYPDAQAVARLDEAALLNAKFSRAKAHTLLRVACMVRAGELPLDDWLADKTAAEAMFTALVAIPGIGPWTANYTLLRGFALGDCSLHGDAVVKRVLQRLLQQAERIDNAKAERWLAEFSPWRSLVAAHLWESKRLGTST